MVNEWYNFSFKHAGFGKKNSSIYKQVPFKTQLIPCLRLKGGMHQLPLKSFQISSKASVGSLNQLGTRQF